jgi:hypothetical protein
VTLVGCDRPAQAELDQLGVAADGVQWRSELVAHRGEEPILRRICHLGHLFGRSRRVGDHLLVQGAQQEPLGDVDLKRPNGFGIGHRVHLGHDERDPPDLLEIERPDRAMKLLLTKSRREGRFTGHCTRRRGIIDQLLELARCRRAEKVRHREL